jgi:hypothetical protein
MGRPNLCRRALVVLIELGEKCRHAIGHVLIREKKHNIQRNELTQPGKRVSSWKRVEKQRGELADALKSHGNPMVIGHHHPQKGTKCITTICRASERTSSN